MRTLCLVVFLLLNDSAFALDTKACFNVEGMTCAACTVTLKASVKKLGGIKEVSASADQGKATVTFDPAKTKVNDIKEKIDAVGYKATIQECKA